MKTSIKSIASLLTLIFAFGSVSLAGFQDIIPRDRISKDLPGGFPGLPVIHEFRILPGCPVFDPDRALLSYRVSNGTNSRIVKVKINALRSPGYDSGDGTIYESPTRSGDVVITSTEGIKDPTRNFATMGYELVVSTDRGKTIRRRISYSHIRPEVNVDLQPSTLTESRVVRVDSRGRRTTFYRYDIRATVQGISSAKTLLVGKYRCWSGGVLMDDLAEYQFSIVPLPPPASSSDRVIIPVWHPGHHVCPEVVILSFETTRRLPFGESTSTKLPRDYYIHYKFNRDPLTLRRDQSDTTYYSQLQDATYSRSLRCDRPEPERPDSPSPTMDDPPSGPLPDLVPVILYADRQVQFRVENRGSAPVTTPFRIHVRDDVSGGLDRYIEVRDRIDPGRSWLSEPLSTGRTIGGPGGTYSEARHVYVDVDRFRQVRESNESNNGAHWERPR